MKKLKLSIITGVLLLFSAVPSFAGTPSIIRPESDIPNLTGGVPLKDISTVDPTLTQQTQLNNKMDDPSHLPKFIVSDPYGTLEKAPSDAVNGAWRTRFTNKTYVYNDDSTYILVKNYFKFKGKWYDKKIILRQIDNQFGFYFSKNEVSFSSDILSSSGSNWGEAKVDTQILDQDGNKARVPGLMIGIDDIDFVNFPREAFRIENFVANVNNTFVHHLSSYMILHGNTVYGTEDSDDYRPVFFAQTGIENGELKNMWYGTPRGAYSGCFISSGLHLRTTNVHYRADSNGEIQGTKDVVTFIGDNASLAETTTKANKNYKFTNWTCDRDLILNDGTVITAGTVMTSEQVEKSAITQDTTFTAHFEKTTGSLKVVKTN